MLDLRIYYLVSGSRIYYSSTAGTIDYVNGKITINSLTISAISNVDGATSTRIRITVIPDSYDIVPVRNQILEIDLVNTEVSAGVDPTAKTGVGFTTTQTGAAGCATTTTTTVTSTPSTPSSSAY